MESADIRHIGIPLSLSLSLRLPFAASLDLAREAHGCGWRRAELAGIYRIISRWLRGSHSGGYQCPRVLGQQGIQPAFLSISLSLTISLYLFSLSLNFSIACSPISCFLLFSILSLVSFLASFTSLLSAFLSMESMSLERERESRAGSCISLSRGGSSWLQRRRWSNTARIAVGGGRPTISLSFDSRGNREVTKGGTKGLCGALFIGPRIIGPGRPWNWLLSSPLIVSTPFPSFPFFPLLCLFLFVLLPLEDFFH